MLNMTLENKIKSKKENRVALLGDSIFDNEPYVSPGEAVIDHINQLNKNGWNAELLAVDGAVTKDVSTQCQEVDADVTHLVISIGGNNALSYVGIFDEKVSTVYQGVQYLSAIKERFQKSYQEMLADILSLDKKIALCTIYNTCPGVEVPLLTALSVFNDVIFQEAFKLGVPVLDFRQTFNSPSDYSAISPIEPSETGGMKTAKAIKSLMETHDFSSNNSVIYY